MNKQIENMQKKEEKFAKINVYFRKDRYQMSGKPVIVECYYNEKIEKLIERYRNSTSDFNQTEKYIFNAKALNPSITVAEAGISNNSVIFVVEYKGLRGGKSS